jgi:hypothetical protein
MIGLMPTGFTKIGDLLYVLWSNGLCVLHAGDVDPEAIKKNLQSQKLPCEPKDVLAFCWWKNKVGHPPTWKKVDGFHCLAIEDLKKVTESKIQEFLKLAGV